MLIKISETTKQSGLLSFPVTLKANGTIAPASPHFQTLYIPSLMPSNRSKCKHGTMRLYSDIYHHCSNPAIFLKTHKNGGEKTKKLPQHRRKKWHHTG